jgi:hypothetical protein
MRGPRGKTMAVDSLKKVVNLAERIGHAFIATADTKGLPHVAVARKAARAPDEERLVAEEWFCPSTLTNLQENRLLAIVVWDPADDLGYQVLGETMEVEDTAIMDGYAPNIARDAAMPQIERRLGCSSVRTRSSIFHPCPTPIGKNTETAAERHADFYRLQKMAWMWR